MIKMKKEVMIVTGAGQIGMAIARRAGFGKKIILGIKAKECGDDRRDHEQCGIRCRTL